MRAFFILLFLFVFISCTESRKDKVSNLVEYWLNRKIEIPYNPIFTIQEKDTVDYFIGDSYKILTYIDSIGCTSCKLKLPEWKNFMKEVDSLCADSVQFVFIFCPRRDVEISHILRINDFKYPVCIDQEGKFNRLNNFSSNMDFQTFLLNGSNEVIAIGNPIHNFKIKELYMGIIKGKNISAIEENRKVKTEIELDRYSVSMGNFDYSKEQKATFTIKNVGDKPLAIERVDMSCGCLSMDYSKEPTRPGMDLILSVTYKAKYPEYFSKTLTVHCNSDLSPIKLTISGNAQ